MTSRPGTRLPVLVLAGAAAFFAYDIIVDLITGIDSLGHVLIEFIVFVAVSAALTAELYRVSRLRRAIILEQSRNARLAGEMLEVMQAQFEAWGLSASEEEVALLLIKGLSMKEIAAVRGVTDKTIRAQAASLYGKSGHAGRHELAAHFIEDLMSTIALDAGKSAA